MREIKFRAWNTPTKMMHYWTLKQLCVTDQRNIIPRYNIWMQYTGLKSKSGVDIYEGDILKYDSTKTTNIPFSSGIGTVEFQAGGFFFVHIDGGWFALGSMSDQSKEVIGNIHENPELLK